MLTLLLLSIIQVGEVWTHWLKRSQVGRFQSNLERLCPESVEIDAVYTWVNGSDPLLLKDLRQYRDENEEVERWSHCPYPDCEPSHIALYRGCDELSEKLHDHIPPIQNIIAVPSLANLVTTNCPNGTSTLIYFTSIDDASKAVHLKIANGTLSQGFWTTETSIPGSHSAPEWIRLSGIVPKFLSLPVDTMKKMLSKQIHCQVLEIWSPSSTADQSFLILKLPSSLAVDQLLMKSRVLSLAGDSVVISRVALVFNTPVKNRFDHYAPSRFEDKEELRYSLRSLERHAPWIRHVYLVTNGQIPHWLDLDYSRITLVTHMDIFPNQSHLPTFSSPAIESHLHRITGLSDKFLYLNDDVMFTQNVWPEDFYTNSRGYRVYLSWPVPDCSPTCLWSWVGDGSCDSECNVVECGFDGGDCNDTDSFPNSLKIHMPRDEFSIYDDLYDLGVDNVDDLMKNVDVNLNNYQPHDTNVENDSKPHPKKGAAGVQQDDDYLIKLQGPFEDYANVKDKARHKRAAVKKNLGSLSYHGSSMVAGRSADFPGSVTNSESAINQALMEADKLREAERPRHRSPFPLMDFNESHLNLNKSSISKEGQAGLLYFPLTSNNTGSKDNYLLKEARGLMNLTNKVQGAQEHSLAFDAGNKTQIFKRPLGISRDKPSNDSLLVEKPQAQGNLTKVRQRFHNLMANELNESFDQTLVNKERHRKAWFKNSKHRILDSFAESLLHVNMLYNKVYGFETRRVPAHAPHLIEKHIMSELQEKFSAEWTATSSHKLRSPLDMQFAFSYFYYLMSEEEDVSIKELFKIYDTDNTGTWSDREIRTLMTRLYPAPLNPHHLLQFEEFVLACARNMPSVEPIIPISTPMYERYQDSPLPTITWELVYNCPELKKLMLTNLGKRKKYPFEVVREWSKDITFKMLHSNVSHLVGHLDDIRRNPKKFVCLNDNLDPKQENENTMVRAVLRDFYHSFFPLPSKFELPTDMRNRFLHVSELAKWKESRAQLRIAAILAVITLCLLTFAVICPDEVRHYGRRILELVLCLQRRRISRTRGKSRSPVRLSSGSRSI